MSTSRTDHVDADDGTFDLHVWAPDGGHGPGLLLIQEIFGVSAYIRAVAERLAEMGYVVAAPDVFWRLQPNWEADHDQAGLEASFGMVQRFDLPQGVADCVAAFHRLRELPEVDGSSGIIGFCLGGTLAYLTTPVADPACSVAYYASGIPGMLEQLDNITCPILLHFGASDSYIPDDQLEAVKAAVNGRSNVTLNVEDAGHAFDNHVSDMFYDAPAAAKAWVKTKAFLDEHLPTQPATAGAS
jgi:carboxymethylenebutenolidase